MYASSASSHQVRLDPNEETPEDQRVSFFRPR